MFEILLTTSLVPFHCLLNISLVLDHNLFCPNYFSFVWRQLFFTKKSKKIIIIIIIIFLNSKSQQNLVGKEKESSQPLEIGHNNNKTREEK
jgi:hypothetical protein